MRKIINNETETYEYGFKLAGDLKPGTVVALTGELGSGKTTLTKAIAEGLNIKETISSPTFNIIKEYESGNVPLYHFDVYRLNTAEDLFDLGYEEYFFGEGVSIVEWADKIAELIPKDAIWIKINFGINEEERIYETDGIEPESLTVDDKTPGRSK